MNIQTTEMELKRLHDLSRGMPIEARIGDPPCAGISGETRSLWEPPARLGVSASRLGGPVCRVDYIFSYLRCSSPLAAPRFTGDSNFRRTCRGNTRESPRSIRYSNGSTKSAGGALEQTSASAPMSAAKRIAVCARQCETVRRLLQLQLSRPVFLAEKNPG